MAAVAALAVLCAFLSVRGEGGLALALALVGAAVAAVAVPWWRRGAPGSVFLPKPFSLVDLTQTVQRQLDAEARPVPA